MEFKITMRCSITDPKERASRLNRVFRHFEEKALSVSRQARADEAITQAQEKPRAVILPLEPEQDN